MNMHKEIQALKRLFMDKLSNHYSEAECVLFAVVAIEGGVKYKKCFNSDHKNMEFDINGGIKCTGS